MARGELDLITLDLAGVGKGERAAHLHHLLEGNFIAFDLAVLNLGFTHEVVVDGAADLVAVGFEVEDHFHRPLPPRHFGRPLSVDSGGSAC